ncbi:MAG: nucleoside triphosphate pyrophosphatase [Pseudomonadales bacterium]
MPEQTVVLASGSPRRAELLRQIGIPFDVVHPYVDESVQPDEDPEAYVERLARSKAASVAPQGRVTLAADTVVVIDGRILGKPTSEDSGIEMLLMLGGREHRVLTAIAVTDGCEMASIVVGTTVRFAEIDRDAARAYWRTGEGADKAGGYGIQGIGGILAESITGSYSAVVGLPLSETERALSRFGIDTWRCRLD